MRTEPFVSADATRLQLYWWDECDKPMGAVKIIHGMCEHMARYDAFARALNRSGLVVLGSDLRGHGPLAQDGLGYAPGDMWAGDLADQRALVGLLAERFPGLPVLIFAHSYGSFLAQRLTWDLPAAGWVLSGSGIRDNPDLYQMMREKALLAAEIEGPGAPAGELAQLTFAAYNAPFAAEGTNAWLSRDAGQVARYNADPLCGFVASANFYASMFGGMLELAKRPWPAADNSPMLLIAGEEDPVGDRGAGVRALGDYFSGQGRPTTVSLYPDARHELLNELCAEQATGEICNFLRRAAAAAE